MLAMNTARLTLKEGEQFRIFAVMCFALFISFVSWYSLPEGGLDMRDDIIPALHNWKMPWKEGTPLFPWAVLMLMPLRLFSARLATALINGLSVILLALLVRRYQGNMLLVIPITLSPLGYWLFSTGQTDALVLAGMLLPPGLDLLFFWKPQVLAHAFWVRAREHLGSYMISGLTLLLISLAIWGFWPKEVLSFGRDQLIGGWWNKSLWPFSIPVGITMVYLSIRNRDEAYGIMASPLLFPYVNGPSYLGLAAIAASKWPRVFWGCYLMYWIYVFIAMRFPELGLRIF
jgi:hypothetical protein